MSWLLNQSERVLYDKNFILNSYFTNQMHVILSKFYTERLRNQSELAFFDPEILYWMSSQPIKARVIWSEIYTEWLRNRSERAVYDQNL